MTDVSHVPVSFFKKKRYTQYFKWYFTTINIELHNQKFDTVKKTSTLLYNRSIIAFGVWC